MHATTIIYILVLQRS